MFSAERDTGRQYDSTIHHYDRLELVEHKDNRYLTNPCYHNISIKDGIVKSQVDGKNMLPSDNDKDEHDYESCTVPKGPVAVNSEPKARVETTDSVPIMQTKVMQEPEGDSTFNGESVINPELTQTPLENMYDTVDGEKNTTESHQLTAKVSTVRNQEKKNQNQVPEYAVVDKTKKTSKLKHDENVCTAPLSVSSPDHQVSVTVDEHIYSDAEEGDPSHEYAEVMSGKVKEKTANDVKTQEKGLLHEYDKVVNPDIIKSIESTNKDKEEQEQHYYYSLENLEESKGPVAVAQDGDEREGSSTHSSNNSAKSSDQFTPSVDQHTHSDMEKWNPSHEYAEVNAGKVKEKKKSTNEEVVMKNREKGLQHEYDTMVNLNAMEFERTLQDTGEQEQHYYHSLENSANGKGGCVVKRESSCKQPSDDSAKSSQQGSVTATCSDMEGWDPTHEYAVVMTGKKKDKSTANLEVVKEKDITTDKGSQHEYDKLVNVNGTCTSSTKYENKHTEDLEQHYNHSLENTNESNCASGGERECSKPADIGEINYSKPQAHHLVIDDTTATAQDSERTGFATVREASLPTIDSQGETPK